MKFIKLKLLLVLMLIAGVKANAQSTVANTAINNVIAAYLEVKTALTADNGVMAEAKAKVLYTQLSAVPVKDLSATEQSAWKSYADKLSFDSRHISETDGIDHQREHFASLSKNMIALVKDLKLNSQQLYVEYCPMKKASWLSAAQTIENPYYGKAMPDCGSVKETLKVVK